MSTTTAKTKKVKKRERNSRESTADKYCDSCNQNITEYEKRDVLRVTNRYDKKLAKNHCKEHELSYGDHKCKPIWCEKCGYLEIYQVIL